MLLEKKVRFAETPGASYQDTGFAFKIWASAERAVLVKNAYLHYRTDNTNSSVKAAAKIYCLCDEYASIDAFILDNPEVKEKVEKLVVSLKYESYRWNLFRLALEYKYAFLLTMHKELVEAREKGLFDKSYFTDRAWENANRIVDDMDGYFDDTCRGELKKYGSVEELSVAANKYWKKSKKLQKKIDDMEASTSLKVGRTITCIPRKIKKALRK